MKIFAFAENVGPQNQIKLIFETAEEQGIDTILATDSNSIPQEYFDHVIIGLEAFDQQNVEKVINKFVGAGVHISIIDDIFNAGLRLNREYAKRCSLVASFGNEEYIARMLSHGYKQVHYHGPPAHWEDLYLQASSNVAEEIKPSRKLVLYAGGKSATFNNTMIRRCVNVLDGNIPNMVFAIGIHPKEEITHEQETERRRLLSRVDYLPKEELSTSEMMAIADVTVFADASTLTIGGAFARKKMIMHYDDEVLKNLRLLGAGNRWFVEELGCMWRSEGDGLFDGLSSSLLDQHHDDSVKEKQEEFFPLPLKWNQAERVVDALEKVTTLVY